MKEMQEKITEMELGIAKEKNDAAEKLNQSQLQLNKERNDALDVRSKIENKIKDLEGKPAVQSDQQAWDQMSQALTSTCQTMKELQKKSQESESATGKALIEMKDAMKSETENRKQDLSIRLGNSIATHPTIKDVGSGINQTCERMIALKEYQRNLRNIVVATLIPGEEFWGKIENQVDDIYGWWWCKLQGEAKGTYGVME